jgi:hypothetical protein
MQKKNTTPRKKGLDVRKREENHDELRRKLARDLAAIFANPVTPIRLHNGLGELLNDLFNDLPAEQARIDETEPYINLLLERIEEAKGGRADG